MLPTHPIEGPRLTVKVKNPKAPAVRREAEEDLGRPYSFAREVALGLSGREHKTTAKQRRYRVKPDLPRKAGNGREFLNI